MPARLLIVDDEPAICFALLRTNLSRVLMVTPFTVKLPVQTIVSPSQPVDAIGPFAPKLSAAQPTNFFVCS